MARLPKSLTFDLPEWRSSDFNPYRKAEEKLREVRQGAGTGSDKFVQRCEQLAEIGASSRSSAIAEHIKSALDARAVTYLLATDEKFCRSIHIDAPLLAAIRSARHPLSRLTLLQLIHAFFKFFDYVFSRESLKLLAVFIKSQLTKYAQSDQDDELAIYAKQAALLFSTEGPHQVVSYAQENSIDLDNALQRLELAALGDTRFSTICNYHYYLETLKTIPVGEAHPLLSEIVKPDVLTAQLNDDGGLLGHEFLRILINRSGSKVSEAWQNVVLSIAGDPRVPKSSDNYRKWWAFLDEGQIALVRGWLSKLDLALFLEVLEQSAKDTGKTDMVSMFRPRRKFMEGLLDQGLVAETRLFLSSWAAHYLRRNYDREELPSYAEVGGTQASMIYLNLKNKVHVIEGSHSFKLNLFDRLPSEFELTNYNKNMFTDGQIRKQPYADYIREYNNDEGAQQLVHDSTGNWRYRAVEYMSSVGLDIDVSQLMTVKEYRIYRRKYGIH